MAVKEGNTRIIATIPIELKDKLDEICDKEKRSLSKQVEYILERYIDEIESKK